MKNIHLIPTDKPSRLYLGNNGNFVFGMIQTSIQSRNDDFTNQHLYITSDEKFNRDEYVTDGVEVIKATPKLVDAQGLVDRRDWRKIILTTDQDLIKDGIQSIDYDFLEWFVKNPSCEGVEVKEFWFSLDKSTNGNLGITSNGYWGYKIIIPKEEPKQTDENGKPLTYWGGLAEHKQVTLEEEPKQESVVNEKCFKCGNSQYKMGKPFCTDDFCNKDFYEKPKQEKSYSEEDMKLAFETGRNFQLTGENNFKELIGQLKKK